MFDETLQQGRVGESLIAQWLRRRGYLVLPVYELKIEQGKGPRLFGQERDWIAPDMLALRADRRIWIEAKNKAAFTKHRITNTWVTGIDLKHYQDYLAIDDMKLFPVWLLFLQRGGRAKGDIEDSPRGLFGESLSVLRHREHHRFGAYGNGGMVYWARDVLRKLAELEEIEKPIVRTSIAVPQYA